MCCGFDQQAYLRQLAHLWQAASKDPQGDEAQEMATLVTMRVCKQVDMGCDSTWTKTIPERHVEAKFLESNSLEMHLSLGPTSLYVMLAQL